MAPINSLLRSARPFTSSSSTVFSSTTRTAFRTSQFQNAFQRSTARTARRFQSTEAPAAAVGQSWFARMWNSPIGLKTVHFWAPVMKWSIVLAGVSDFYRPAEKLSLTQNVALTCTGAIWTRWCLIIKPKNVLLATVNFFLGCVGVIQVTRILMWQSSQKNMSAGAQVEEAKDAAIDAAKGVVGDVKAAVAK